MEKHTEHIGHDYITKLLNITEYNTTGNKQLFNNKIPDGWLMIYVYVNDDNIILTAYN